MESPEEAALVQAVKALRQGDPYIEHAVREPLAELLEDALEGDSEGVINPYASALARAVLHAGPAPEELPDWRPDTGWSHQEWATETKAVRAALEEVGVIVPHCLPGEPGDCGAPVWSHYASYLAMLKARTQVMLEATLCEPAPGVADHYSSHVYASMLAEYRADLEQQ